MYIPINPWGGIDPEDIPHIEVSDKGARILKWVLVICALTVAGLLVYAYFFLFK